MTKQENIDAPGSCWNKAAPGEVVFILKESDPSFSATVAFWAAHRVRTKTNEPLDGKIVSANATAEFVAMKGKQKLG